MTMGKELDKILKKEGVIDEEVEDLGDEEKVDLKEIGDKTNVPIGKVVTVDGRAEKPVYLNRRPHRVKKYTGYREKRKYTCDICRKEFMHIGRYEVHRKSHKIKYACQGKECQVQDSNKDVVIIHQKQTDHVGISIIEQMNAYNGTVVLPDPDSVSDSTVETSETISENKPIKCPICEKSFTCKQNYEVHLKAIHDGEKPFKCTICQRPFAYACTLKSHMISHKNKENDGKIEQFPCDKCGKIFQHPSSLFYHRDTEHGNQRFICNKCNKSFKHRQLLQRHQTVHTQERPFKCTECNQTFKTKTNLINHENVHTGLKKYTCPSCGQAFTHKTSLAVHIRLHEGSKPYKCDVCKKAFSQKGNLKEHRRIHTGEKPYSCNLCGKSFTTSSQFKLHIKRHTGEKPFSCEYCQKRFLHKETYNTHIRRHLDIRPYKCTYCTRTFSESWACSRHQRIHLGEKPYHCDVCDKSFGDASNFGKHTKIHLKNGVKPQSVEGHNNQNNKVIQPSPVDIQIIIPPESETVTRTKTEIEVDTSNLQIQELLDGDGNTISFTTADGQPIPIVSSGSEKIQGLMPDGTLVSFDLLPESQHKEEENEQRQEATHQEINLINSEIQYLEEDSIPHTSIEKPAFLSEDGKVCFITSFEDSLIIE